MDLCGALVCCAEESLLGCAYPSDYKLMGRDKGETCYHVADIPKNLFLLFDNVLGRVNVKNFKDI